MGTLFGVPSPNLRGMSGSVPAPPDLKRISGGEFVQILNSGNLRKLCATHDGPCMMYPTGKDCGRESTEHNTAAPDTWPRVRDCAYGQADAVRTGTARCAGPDPCCSGLSMIPPVTRCVVVDLAPQAMIGRVWVCAGSIMTDKTHRQGAITRCIHATECQAAVPWFTFTTFTVAHVQFGMHAARAHPHKHMRMCSSAYELHFDVSTTPRRACAAEKRRFARQLVHDDFCICAPERN